MKTKIVSGSALAAAAIGLALAGASPAEAYHACHTKYCRHSCGAKKHNCKHHCHTVRHSCKAYKHHCHQKAD